MLFAKSFAIFLFGKTHPNISVETAPGQIALTLISFLAFSSAAHFVIPFIACLDALYSDNHFQIQLIQFIEDTFTIDFGFYCMFSY